MRTVGVEEELLLVDPRTGRPVAAADGLVGRDPRVVGEFAQEMVELRTGPHTAAADLVAELGELRATVTALAGDVGAAPGALSVSPLGLGGTVTDTERYRAIIRDYGVLPRRHLTCGTHVHVQVADDDEGVIVLDGVRGWLPTLLALTAGSPFRAGEDTGFASYRWQLTSRWPVSGPPPTYGSAAAYHRYVQSLLASGVIRDSGMIYHDARLSHHLPTVEIRIADVTADVLGTVALALAVRALVQTAATGRQDRRATLGARASEGVAVGPATWLASWHGLSGRLIDPRSGRPAPAAEVVAAFLEHVGPVLEESQDADLVRGWAEQVLRSGGEARRQRAVFGRTGSLREVVADVVGRTTVSPSAGRPDAAGPRQRRFSRT